MDGAWSTFIGAVWLGILTAISPCPLSTNIVAISFIGKDFHNPLRVFAAGTLYTLGRTFAYIVLGAILVTSMFSTPEISNALQYHLNRIMGPVLIIAGMALLEWLSFNFSLIKKEGKLSSFFQKTGLWGAFPLGIIFALSFCPTSAALFFGSLLPLALSRESSLFIPAVYGISTGIPVLLFAFIIAFGTGKIASCYNRIGSFEKWARLITGWLFIAVGIYFSLTYIFGFSL